MTQQLTMWDDARTSLGALPHSTGTGTVPTGRATRAGPGHQGRWRYI
jgi:hypothetical protein